MSVQLPERSAEVDITLVTRGITVSSHVEASGDRGLVVRPHFSTYLRNIRVKPGDAVEVYWQAPEEELKLPAEISELEDSADLLLHLAVTGAPERSQRRKAVRASVELPVLISCQGVQLPGTTVDLSEAGLRAWVDGWGLQPQPATPATVSLTLEDGGLDLEAVVVRQQARGARWELSLRFGGLPENDEDRLRRRVFQALREERARAAD